MRCITRIHLSDCGWHEAYYPGTTIELSDPRTGEPRHTVFSLENTGGKTTFLALVLSCFDTNERRFLKTMIRPNQRFGDYFGEVPAFIIVEWDLVGGQPVLWGTERLITGQVVVPQGEGRNREMNRRFFTFRSVEGLDFEDTPAPGLRGFEQHGRLGGQQDVQRWLHQMRVAHPGNFQDFVRQSDWKRKLAEEKIDTELLANQVEFNRSEGGIEDFLNFRSEEQFVRKFLGMTVPEAEAGSVRAVLLQHVERLSDLPRLEQRRESLRRLREHFAPFVEVAGEFHAAEEVAVQQARHAVGARVALVRRAEQSAREADAFTGKAVASDAAAAAAAAAIRQARIEFCSAAVETARRKYEEAAALAARRDEEQARALHRRNLLQGASLMRKILHLRVRSLELQNAIDDAQANLQPRRNELRHLGANLVATLESRAAAARERQRSLAAEAVVLKARAQEADRERKAAQDTALAEHTRMTEIEASLDHARDQRAKLEAAQVLEAEEKAEDAAGRHREAARSAAEESKALCSEAETIEGEARKCWERRGDLKAERADLDGRVALLRGDVQEGEARRRQFALDSLILQVTGEKEVDPGEEAVARLLAEARRQCENRMRDGERRREVLEADRESLEATGIASVDRDARAVTERLRAAGIPDAQPFAAYLSRIAGTAESARSFAESDPARFAGVSVPNSNALERARMAMESVPPLSRPVTVAIASDTAENAPGDRFVLTVEEPAAYDHAAARALQRRMEEDLKQIEQAIAAEHRQIDRLDDTLRGLEEWRKRFGGGQLDAFRRNLVSGRARLEEIGTELAALSDRIKADEAEARTLRQRASQFDEQARNCREYARRAEEHHAEWESRVRDWELARLHHEQAFRNARALESEKETERDALSEDARNRERQAETAAAHASALEREFGGIDYAGPGGTVSADLDTLRQDYAQRLDTLKTLEQDRVDRLRGQQEEIRQVINREEDQFQKRFSELDRGEVEAEAKQENVDEAAIAAEAELDNARMMAADARARRDSAEREHRDERERRQTEIQPDPFLDLQSLAAEELTGRQPRAEKEIVAQESIRASESRTAARARSMAAQEVDVARECEQLAANLEAALGGDPVSPDAVELPRREEVAGLVNAALSALRQAQGVQEEARRRIFESYDRVQRFLDSDVLNQLEGEREVVLHLRKNKPLAAAADANRTSGLIDDRLTTIEHDLSRLDEDLKACVDELDRLFRTARNILRRMVRDGRIPDHVPRFGGLPVFRAGVDLSRVSVMQRKEILHRYVKGLAEANKVPETGQDVAAELVARMASSLGREALGIRLLKPKGEGDTEHMPIDRVTVSGGELLTAAMMIYLVLARLRRDALQGSAGNAGVLMMDNPLGKANKALLLKTQIALADAMGIQLFYTTGIQDTNALAEFENIVRLRRNRQSRTTGRIHVEVEAMRVQIDHQPDSGAPAAADMAPVA